MKGESYLFVVSGPSGVGKDSVLEQRLRGRGTDSEEAIRRRLDIAREELGHAGEFDAWIVNHTLEQAAGELYRLMAHKVDRT